MILKTLLITGAVLGAGVIAVLLLAVFAMCKIAKCEDDFWDMI